MILWLVLIVYSSAAFCDPGDIVIDGGHTSEFQTVSPNDMIVFEGSNLGSPDSEYIITILNNSPEGIGRYVAWAFCFDNPPSHWDFGNNTSLFFYFLFYRIEN